MLTGGLPRQLPPGPSLYSVYASDFPSSRMSLSLTWPLLHLLGDFFLAAFQCPHKVERIGTMGDGGKWVCGIERVARQPECVVYSFGTPAVVNQA